MSWQELFFHLSCCSRGSPALSPATFTIPIKSKFSSLESREHPSLRVSLTCCPPPEASNTLLTWWPHCADPLRGQMPQRKALMSKSDLVQCGANKEEPSPLSWQPSLTRVSTMLGWCVSLARSYLPCCGPLQPLPLLGM